MSTWEDRFKGETIRSALEKACRRYASKEAMIFEKERVTFEELLERSALVARGFLSLGVQRGDRVAIWMAGYAEWAYLYFALAGIGAVMVPVNSRYKETEIAHVLNKSGARFLVLKEDERRGKSPLGILRKVCGALDRAQPGKLNSARLPHLQGVIAISDKRFPGCFSFGDLLEMAAGVSTERMKAAETRVTGEDVALILFTSGTTALPKGAMLYQSAMLRAAHYLTGWLGISEDDRFFSPQPFFHAGGAIHVMLSPVMTGCTIIVQPYFEPAEALRMMAEHRCTVTLGHQPHYVEYLNHPDLKKRELHLKKGYAFVPPDLIQRVQAEMGIDVLISAYGLTETHLGGTLCRFDDPNEKRLLTVGRCMPGMALAVRDVSTGEDLPAGESGEICFRGWCVMRGYYDDPEMTSAVIDDEGWFRTGDLGVVDSDGYLRLVGRVKDMIRVGGENVAAQDVEAFLLKHEKIKQAQVVGVPDPRLGEVCAAFIEVKPSSDVTEDDILQYCRASLASFKVPRRVVFTKEWPMSGTGKIQKFLLRESLVKY